LLLDFTFDSGKEQGSTCVAPRVPYLWNASHPPLLAVYSNTPTKPTESKGQLTSAFSHLIRHMGVLVLPVWIRESITRTKKPTIGLLIGLIILQGHCNKRWLFGYTTGDQTYNVQAKTWLFIAVSWHLIHIYTNTPSHTIKVRLTF
jgi:hypothetical protein